MREGLPSACLDCPLSEGLGVGFVPPALHKGRGNGLVLVGMAPEKWEVKAGEPFVGRAGQILRKAIYEAGMRPDEFDILNTLQCQPPDMHLDPRHWWLDPAISHCRAHRDKVFRRESPPEAIIALGNTPFKMLTGQDNISKKRGYVYWSEEYKCKIVGSYHPSFIGRGKTGLIQALIYDIKLAWRKPVGSFPLESLILYPTVQDFREWVEKVMRTCPEWIVFDIETPYSAGKPEDEDLEQDPSSEIIRISFALPDGRAITVPWVGGYIDICREILSSDIDKVLFNADYDVPRVEVNGCKVNGMIIDVMWLFHFLFPDLPRSLAATASFYTTLPEWKSLGSKQPELYSALDSHATALCFIGIKKHLQEKGMWQVAWDHVVRLMQILRKIRHRGLLIDRLDLRKFQRYLQHSMTALAKKINTKVPDEIKKIHVISAKHLRGRCSCAVHPLGKSGKLLKKLVPAPSCGTCSGSGWMPPIKTTLPFNPESSEQLKAYMGSMGHKPPSRKDKETGETKETTEKKFLIVLSRQYPTAIYTDTLKHRQLAKLYSTYTKWPMRPCPEFGENNHGKNRYYRVSTRLGQAPATGRLSSENPNMQNIPKEGPLAERFKNIIHCTPGHILVKRDYSGIEAVLTGYFAHDPEYMRLALLGVHTFRCAEFKGEAPPLELRDDLLSGALKQLKKKYDTPEPGEDVSLYQRFKKINHMTNYGAKPVKIWNESPGVFKDLAEVKKLYKFFRAKSPKIFQWHQALLRRIPREDYRLVTPYMYNRYFWDLPNDLPKAIAQLPQSTAAAIIKESMLLVDASPEGEFLVLSVHDELVFDFPIGPGTCPCHPDNKFTYNQRDENIRQIMERPLPNLGGLVISTEGTSGLTYGAH